MRKRFAVTVGFVGNNFRELAFGNRSSNFHDTKENAETFLFNIKNNSADNLNMIFGADRVKTLRVDEIECYDNGDAPKTFFEDFVDFGVEI